MRKFIQNYGPIILVLLIEYTVLALVGVVASWNDIISIKAAYIFDTVLLILELCISIVIIRKHLSLADINLRLGGFKKSFWYSALYFVPLIILPIASAKFSITWTLANNLVYYFPVLALTVFLEELIYRGLVLNTITKRKNFYVAVGVSMIIFGLSHLVVSYYEGGAISISDATSRIWYGSALGVIAYLTGNIWGTYAWHLIYDIFLIYSSLSISDGSPISPTWTGILLALAYGAYQITSPIIIAKIDAKISNKQAVSLETKKYIKTIVMVVVVILIFAAMLLASGSGSIRNNLIMFNN